MPSFITESFDWATGWTNGAIGFRFPAGARNFSLHHASRLVLGPTQPSVKWVPEFLSRGKAAGAWSWPLESI